MILIRKYSNNFTAFKDNNYTFFLIKKYVYLNVTFKLALLSGIFPESVCYMLPSTMNAQYYLRPIGIFSDALLINLIEHMARLTMHGHWNNSLMILQHQSRESTTFMKINYADERLTNSYHQISGCARLVCRNDVIMG